MSARVFLVSWVQKVSVTSLFPRGCIRSLPRKLALCGADLPHPGGTTWTSRTSKSANCSIAAMPVTTPALRPAGVTLTKKTIAAQHSTAQHSTTQHSSQHSTTQHSTAHIHLVLIPSFAPPGLGASSPGGPFTGALFFQSFSNPLCYFLQPYPGNTLCPGALS